MSHVQSVTDTARAAAGARGGGRHLIYSPMFILGPIGERIVG